jgi:hypothetical protein
MFADTQILDVFIIFYFFYAFYDVIRNFFASFKQQDKNETQKKDRKITNEMIQEAMNNRKFGEFTLAPAVVFFKDGDVVPSKGYKIDKLPISNGITPPFRMLISASAEDLLDIFDDFIALLGENCSVAVEDFRTNTGDRVDYFAFYKETFIVRSILLDFDDLLLNDGFVGLSIWNEIAQAEVQLTMHKILQVYAKNIVPFQQTLTGYGIPENPDLRFFFEDFYMLVSTHAGDSAVEELKDRLCIDHSVVQQQGGFEAMNN